MASNAPIIVLALSAVLLMGILPGGSAQVVGWGSCPSPPVVPTLDLNQYAGVWYEYSKYPLAVEALQSCVTATYTPNGDGTVRVHNKGKILGTSVTVSVNGTARQVSQPPDGKLGVTFNGIPFAAGRQSPYWVLATDYTNYAVVWSCSKVVSIFNSKSLWILTRQAVPDNATLAAANQVLINNGIDLKPLRKTEQTRCSPF